MTEGSVVYNRILEAITRSKGIHLSLKDLKVLIDYIERLANV